jgi:hypothetical protein
MNKKPGIRSPIVTRLLFGIALFIGSFFLDAVSDSILKHRKLFGWGFLLTAIFQTSGFLMMTSVNVDANLLLKRLKPAMVLLATVWTIAIILEASSTGNRANQICLIGILPWAYLIFRYRQVSNLEDGYPRFTELVVLCLILTLLYEGIWYILIGPVSSWQGSEAQFWYCQAALAAYYLLGAMMVLYLSYLHAPWRAHAAPMAQQETVNHQPSVATRRALLRFNPSIQFYMSSYAFLFVRGSALILRQVLLSRVGHQNASNEPFLLPTSLCAGPVQVLPALTVFCCGKAIQRRLGKYWLSQQEAQWRRCVA